MIKIYSLKDPLTKKVMYIGKTEQALDARLVGHIHSAYFRKKRQFPQKDYWVASLFKRSLLPIIELIENVEIDKGDARECYWVEHYIKTNKLFNVYYNPQNTLINDARAKKIYQYTLNGAFIKEWRSMLAVEKSLGIYSGNITRAAGTGKYKRKEAGGFQWRFYKANSIVNYKKDLFKKPVHQYNLDGSFIKTWGCARDTVIEGFNFKNISQCCTLDKKSHKGYQWSFDKVENLGSYIGKLSNYKIQEAIKSQDIVRTSEKSENITVD